MRIWKYFGLVKGYWVPIIVSIAFTILLQLGYSYVPFFISYIIELLEFGSVSKSELPSFLLEFFVSGETVIQTIVYVLLALIGLQLMRFTIMFFEHFFRGQAREGLSRDLRIRLYDHIQNLPFKYHNNVDTGDLVQRVTSDVESSTVFLSDGLGNIVYLIASISFGAVRLAGVNLTMMIIALSAIPLVALASILYFKKIDVMYKEIETAESNMTVVIQENLSGSKVVKAFANEKFEIDKMDEKSIVYRDKVRRVNDISAYYWAGMDAFSFLQYLIFLIIGIFSIQAGEMSGGEMIAALSVVGMLVWPIRQLGRIVNLFSRAIVASNRLFEILDMETEYVNDGTLTPKIEGKIEFKDVYFKFDDTDDHLLNGLSFTINQGDTVAIVGKTGSGKSTIINLLLRMYDYTKGSILIDGVELLNIEKQYIRSNIGAVLQDPFLYSKSVYENIAITDRSVDDSRVFDAASIATIEKDIQTFKDGYETLVGEKGATLSGGQKQRVAIARVLVADKPILIFDDALSAVDTKTDIAIRKALNNKQNKSTNIIITHRITTAKEADKIIVLNNGKVEAIGTHDELKSKKGLYKVLWDIQGKLETEFLKMIEGDARA